jgi:hypothetical protein
MNYLNRASKCCLRQNLHTFICFCIITVELLGGDCNEKPRLGTGRVASLAHLETIRKEVEAMDLHQWRIPITKNDDSLQASSAPSLCLRRI